MPQLAIRGVDNNHPNQIKNISQCYKAGDIVDVLPDDWVFGKDECFPNFYIVRITGMTVEAARVKYMQPEYTGILDRNGDKVIKKRRKYKFDLSRNLTTIQKNDIRFKNWAIVNIDRTKIENKSLI